MVRISIIAVTLTAKQQLVNGNWAKARTQGEEYNARGLGPQKAGAEVAQLSIGLQKCNEIPDNKIAAAVSWLCMHTRDNRRLFKLQEGQLWKIEQRYLWIEALGERLIHYKMLKEPHAKAAITQLIQIEALLNFLSQTEAELVGVEPLLCARAA